MKESYLAEVRKINGGPRAGPEDETERAAVILLASYRVGPHIRRIARETGIPISTIQPIARRYREQGIWIDDKVAHPGDGGDDKNAGWGFILHTLVGVGHVRRVEVSA